MVKHQKLCTSTAALQHPQGCLKRLWIDQVMSPFERQSNFYSGHMLSMVIGAQVAPPHGYRRAILAGNKARCNRTNTPHSKATHCKAKPNHAPQTHTRSATQASTTSAEGRARPRIGVRPAARVVIVNVAVPQFSHAQRPFVCS
jgi:hypothetical protein